MLALFFTMVIILFVTMVIDYYLVYSKNMEALKKETQIKTFKAVETLKQPLWHYDVQFIRNYAEVLFNDHSVIQISIFDERNKEIAHLEKTDAFYDKRDKNWQMEQVIQVKNKTVGRLRIQFTNSQIRSQTTQMLLLDIVMIVTALFSVLGIIWLLVTKQILMPLKIMENSFHKISQGDYSKRVALEKKNELSEIAKEFNTMVDQVESRERKIRESEIKYRNLVESSSDIIFKTDLRGHLVIINRNFEKWTGFDSKELIFQPFTRLFSSPSSSFSMETLKKDLEEENLLLYELRLIKKDRFVIPVELNISIQEDSSGQPDGIIGIARDITKRLQTEKELRKYEQMVASNTDYMWLIDKKYIIQAVNDAYLKIVGKSRESLIGHHVESILGKDLALEKFVSHFETCLTGKNVKHQSWVDMPGLGPRFMEITYYPIFKQDKTVSGIMINERDITERKNLESRLHQSEKMEAIGTLAGGIAHDFNNIIGGIIGYAEMIEMFDINGNEKVRSRIQHVLKGAYRAKELIGQILTFSRHSDQKKKPVNLNLLIAETMKFLRASIPSTIEIVEKLDHPNCVVWADETSMHQVLMNLCTNASHAMPETGGTLSVSLRKESIDIETAQKISIDNPGEFVKISVKDTGDGIEPHILERIFDPFFTTKKTGDGTGMGLSVVHGIVQNLNGTIKVNSSPGSGSSFDIYIPLFDSPLEPEKVSGADSPVPLGRGRILFIDDEEELVSFSSEILEHIGYEVVGKTSSIDARQAFLTDPMQFDLVITDQTMPNITGFDLALEFLEKRKDIPIVLCTGFSLPDLERKAMASGIACFVKKPLGARQLADLVKRLISVGEVPAK